MKKIIKFFILIISCLFLTGTSVVAWIGLTGENGDFLTIEKWNEMIVELNKKINKSNIIAGTNVTLTNSGSDIVVSTNAGKSGIYPFINSTFVPVAKNYNGNVRISGENFNPFSTVNIPNFNGTINSVNVISPKELNLNLTTINEVKKYDIIINNGGNLSSHWPNNGKNILSVGAPSGTGPSGIYLENFESGNLGNWYTTLGSADLSWQTEISGTQNSSNTGPLNAASGIYYIYTEASSPNYPNKTFYIETSYFNFAKSISFDYHMYGSTMGTLNLQVYNGFSRITVYTLSGQYQTSETAPWVNSGNIDLSLYDVELIRFFYTSGSNYTGDAAIDNIQIISD